jgi:tRNA-intron endonuclease
MVDKMAQSEGQRVKALFTRERVVSENSDAARELHNASRFGTMKSDGRVELSLLEALYLTEKERMTVIDGHGKDIPFDKLFSKSRRIEPNFQIRYYVFKDLRSRGYIVKTALKFGADFRVYDRGVKPGEDHAKWIVFPSSEGETFTWHDFAAKNRVAHSTKKKLLLAVVDDEGDVTYWEVRWMRP